MNWGFLVIIPFLGVIYWLENWHGKRFERERAAELKRLKSLPNYRRLVSLKSKGREYVACVAEWNKKPGVAELWCIEGPNPDGYSYHFLWPHDELEFIN